MGPNCISISGECAAVYGPVASRRHGLSLGINLGDEHHKVCTWGCLYCQCGFGGRADSANVSPSVSAKTIIELVGESVLKRPEIESITLAGNTEPCSSKNFAEVVDGLLQLRKRLNGRWIINCLSNGSELNREDVVQTCNLLDETWIKLDCGIDQDFRRLNRPLARIGTVAEHVAAIRKLSKIYIQTLVWTCQRIPMISNWTEANRNALLGHYQTLKPEKIHLTTLAREPATPALQAVDELELQQFAEQIRKSGLAVEVFP